MTAYTHEQLAQLKSFVARGVLSGELAGEKVTFRSLDEIRQIIAMMEAELNPASAGSGSMYRPTFSRS